MKGLRIKGLGDLAGCGVDTKVEEMLLQDLSGTREKVVLEKTKFYTYVFRCSGDDYIAEDYEASLERLTENGFRFQSGEWHLGNGAMVESIFTSCHDVNQLRNLAATTGDWDPNQKKKVKLNKDGDLWAEISWGEIRSKGDPISNNPCAEIPIGETKTCSLPAYDMDELFEPIFDAKSIYPVCSDCGGSGKYTGLLKTEPCSTCNGAGVIR